MKAPLSYLPALPAAAGLTAGILAGDTAHPVMAATLVLAVAAILYALRRHYAGLCLMFAGVGMMLNHAHRPHELPPALYDADAVVTGTIRSEHERAGSTAVILEIHDINGAPVPGVMCSMTMLTSRRLPCPGTEIITRCTLQPVGQDALMPYETDYDRFLLAEGITCRALLNPREVQSATDAGRLRAGDVAIVAQAPAFDRWLQRVRDALYDAIVMSAVDSDTASFLAATILGDDTLLQPDVTDTFRDTGVAHVLAISGMHVGILVSMLSVVLFPLTLARRGNVWRTLLTLLLVWGYALVVGMTPSIIRAAVMVSVFMCARHIQRGYSAWNSLLLSVVIILCINPRWLQTPGFQLSVGAVASILAFGGMLPRDLKRRPWLYYGLNMLLIPVAAMIGTGVIGAWYFGTFPWWFLVSNVVTGLLFPLIVGGGILLMLCTACGVEASWLGAAVNWLYGVLTGFIGWLDSFDGMSVRGLTPPPLMIALYYAAVATGVWALYRTSEYLQGLTLRRPTALWICTGALVVLTLASTDIKPVQAAAELYIPRDSRQTHIIMRAGPRAAIYTVPGSDIDGADWNTRYRRYLNECQCDTFLPAAACELIPPFLADSMHIVAGRHMISVVGAGDIRRAVGMPVTYALVTKGYTGKISDIVRTLRPDTLLLSADLPPSRRARLRRECADSVPYLDLSRQTFSIVWP